MIAGLQLQYAEETGIKSLKIKHNNVLGYFIEVTAGNSGPMTDTPEAKARFIHRQTMAKRHALHHDGTGGSGKPYRQRR